LLLHAPEKHFNGASTKETGSFHLRYHISSMIELLFSQLLFSQAKDTHATGALPSSLRRGRRLCKKVQTEDKETAALAMKPQTVN